MGVMEKMRNSTASILWILIFSFGFLWVMADTQVFDAIGAGPQSMGEVNGVPITFDDYNERVAYYTEQFNRQSTDALTSEIRAGFEQRAWDDLVAAELMRQKMDALGITVTDEEVGEMILGDDPVQFIRDQFADEEGNIDRVALRAAIEAPENQEIWVVVEDQLRQTRRQEKLNNFIMAGMKPTQLEIEQEFVNENTFADVRFIRFPFIEIPDSLLNNSEEELRAYHRENSNRFQREETYQFRYVSWDIRPTETDTLNTIRDIERLADGFARAEDVAEFLELNQSDVPFTDEFVPEDEIQENFRFVADLAVGEVSDLRMINGNPHLLKKVDENRDGIKYAVMTYRVVPDPVGTVDALAEQAREFEFYASEDDFQDEADRRELVVQVGSATKGSQFVPGIGVSQQLMGELEKMDRNDITEPIELSDKFLVVQLLETTPAGTRPLDEVREQVDALLKNDKRREMLQERVQGMLAGVSTIEELDEMVDQDIQEGNDIRMGGTNLPGGGREPEVVGSFFQMEQGVLSGSIAGQNAVYVAVVDEFTWADAEAITDSDVQRISTRLEQQRVNAFNANFIDQLKEEAKIKDFRSLVLR